MFRIAGVTLSAFLLYYGTAGIIANDIYIPPGRGQQIGSHAHGLSAWLVYISILCGVSSMLAAILRHYHGRKFEHIYRPFIKWSHIFAWTFVAAVVIIRILDTIN